jgi:hypothetical protein
MKNETIEERRKTECVDRSRSLVLERELRLGKPD